MITAKQTKRIPVPQRSKCPPGCGGVGLLVPRIVEIEMISFSRCSWLCLHPYSPRRTACCRQVWPLARTLQPAIRKKGPRVSPAHGPDLKEDYWVRLIPQNLIRTRNRIIEY